MSLPKWPELLGSDAVDALFDAVTTVAGKSFFAGVERCDEQQFAKLSDDTGGWWVASVHFTEGDEGGVVSCMMAEDLVHSLFDAFSGRDPLDPLPGSAALVDLVGEFCNMICGRWLTRLAKHQTFSLSRPTVQPVPARADSRSPDARLLLAVDGLPLAVEVRIAAPAARSTATAGA